MKKVYPFLLFLFFVSCSIFRAIRPIKVSKIERIYLDFNPSQNINFGQPILGGVVAQMLNGKEHSITTHKNLSINSLELTPTKDGFLVSGKPTSFSQKYFYINGVFKNLTSPETREFVDSIPINYLGDIKIDFSGSNGRKGQDGKDGKNSIFDRHGASGYHGENGESGENAPDITVKVWKINDTIKAVVKNERTFELFYYQGISAQKIFINASGGNGGSAGDGGDGDHGKKGKTGSNLFNNRPGDGGTAGNGGNGGHGGDGGRVKCVIHPSAEFLMSEIEVKNNGGWGGIYGNPGKSGLGGQPLSNQIAGKKGYEGFKGVRGKSGASGGEPKILVESFDFSVYNNH